MEDQDEHLAKQEAESFYSSEIKRLGLNMEIAEPHLTAIDKLGQGGSGEVTESYDEILGRTVAVKTLHDELKEHPKLVERMIREAQAAAQLEHPNIVPIYALGVSPTKGVYFTMKRLRGDSLRHIITQLALKNPAYTWEYTPSRRLSIFIRICQGVSYAHSKGILHRDLKPENIRIGNYGEVTIIDWGLVREMVKKPGSDEHGKDNHTKVPKDKQWKPGFTVTEYNLASQIIADSNPTIDGELSGTPRYMSPEQADAQNSELDKRSDIYSLGVILYELLTCFNPFYDKKEESAIIDAVMHGNYLKPRQFAAAANVPVELEAICLKALELNKEMRYQTVDDMLRDIYAHQEGRQVQAYKGNFFTSIHKLLKRNPIRSTILISGFLSVFLFMGIMHTIRSRQYSNVLRQVKNALDDAYSMQELMQNQLDSKAGTLDMSSPTIKGLQTNIDNQLDTATRLLSSIPESHVMVHHYRERILLHRLRHDARNMRIDEINKDINLVSEFFGNDTQYYSSELSEAIHLAKDALYGVCNISSLDSVPYKSEVRIQNLRVDDNGLLKGNGFLPLREFATKESTPADSDKTNPANEETPSEGGNQDGTIVEQDIYTASTPIQSFDIDKGNYSIQLKTENGMELNLPLFLSHAETRDIIIKIPKDIPSGTVYVPEGKFIRGGANGGVETLAAFFIGKHEVTFAQYIEFWKTLDTASKKAFMARIQFKPEESAFDAWDENGKIKSPLSPNLPVIGISHPAASAYCKWLGEKLGRECRLPTASEWEKAARGPDGRKYPWGDRFNSEYAFTIENKSAAQKFGHIAKGGSFKMDCSPYGAMDMAGNAREWTSSDFGDDSEFRQIKGASSATSQRYLPLFKASEMTLIPTDVGFRILLPSKDEDFSK